MGSYCHQARVPEKKGKEARGNLSGENRDASISGAFERQYNQYVEGPCTGGSRKREHSKKSGGGGGGPPSTLGGAVLI